MDLGLHFDLCENERNHDSFYELKMLDKVLFNIYLLKQKWAS